MNHLKILKERLEERLIAWERSEQTYMKEKESTTITGIFVDPESVCNEWRVMLSNGDTLYFESKKKAERFAKLFEQNKPPIKGV